MVRPPRTGLEAFELLPEGTLCQLINNAIIMSPAPNTPHARLQNKIFNALFNYVGSNKRGEVFCAPVDVYLDERNVYQPDIFYIAADRLELIKKRGVFGAPDLVVEVLSENRKIDLVIKKKVYEFAGVKEYWVVDPETRWCEGFELSEGKFQSIGEATGVIAFRLLSLTVAF